jgi:hypothetical protein
MRNDQEDAAKLDRLLRRSKAAQYITHTYGIPCSPKTLAKYACIGGGPPFRLAGRFPLYPVSGLDEWARSKIGPLVRSTSELHRIVRKRMSAAQADADQRVAEVTATAFPAAKGTCP